MKKILILIFMLLLSVSCRNTIENDAYTGKESRIISTAPSNTEILVGLGLGSNLVAVDSYSANLPGVPESAVVFDFTAPDTEMILSLSPDIIVTSEINQVSTQTAFQILENTGIATLYIPTSQSLEEIYESVMTVAAFVQREEAGQILVDQMQERIEAIKEKTRDVQPKTVYFELNPAPALYSFGNGTFLNEYIEIAGGRNIFADHHQWLSVSEEAIFAYDPDVIFTSVDFMADPVGEIKSRAGWQVLSAVADDRVFVVDGSATIPSPESVSVLEAMVRAIHPDLFEDEVKEA